MTLSDRDWQPTRLKFLADLRSGSSIAGESISEEGLYPVYGGNGIRGFTDGFTHSGEFALIGRQGALCGNVHRASGRFWASEHAVVATMRSGTNASWYGYLTESMNLGQYSVSAAQPGLAVDRIRELPVRAPPLSKQTVIANYLDEKTAAIDALIEKKRKLPDLLAEERAALINQAVTKGLDPTVPMKDSGIPWIGEIPAHWEVPQLGHCLSRITYGFNSPMPSTDEGPFMLTANDVQDGRIEYETARHTDPHAVAALTEKYKPKDGGVLLTKDRTLGRVAVADGTPMCINQSVALLRADSSRLTAAFLSWMLRSGSYQDWMIFDAGGTTIKHIYITRVVKMTAVVPPLDEQEGIASYADHIAAQHARANRALLQQVERLQEYRQALITAAVTSQFDIEAAA